MPTPSPRSGNPGRGRGELIEELVHQRQRGVANAAIARQAEGVLDLAAEVDDGAAEFLAGEVDADQVAGVAFDVQQNRRLATARGSVADLFDELLLEQVGDDLRDGRARELGLAGHLGAGDLAEVVDGAQDETIVVGLGLLVGGFEGRQGARAGGRVGLAGRDWALPASMRVPARLCQHI